METQTFFNTTNEADRLPEFEQKAVSDEKLIMDHYDKNPYEGNTPYMLLEKLGGGNLLRLGSFKRAMSNLSNETKYNPPYLVKTKLKGTSPAGRMNHFWVKNPVLFKGQLKVF